MVKIAPSILSADFARLGSEVAAAEAGGGDWIHVDVMDGHFVPNITLGSAITAAIRPYTNLPLDVHLMIEQPERYVTDFIKAGANVVTVHAEACTHLHRVLHMIKEQGALCGVALNPGTSPYVIKEVLNDVDMVLVMTVNPGFGGQSFIPGTLGKIRQIRSWLNELGRPDVHIEVDGGIAESTAALVAEAGADVLVAGSAVFGREDRAAAIASIRAHAEGRAL
ncbi:Ribulose-phosphate 3-epimerase [compost metagenome]